MNTFTLRTKIFSAWKLNVIGMSLQECIDYIRECFLPQDWMCVVVWSADERQRIAEVSPRNVWVCREWADRLDECSALEMQHEKY